MSDRLRLGGQVAVVTGALGRLGAVWTGALLGAGAKVVGIDVASAPVSSSWAKRIEEQADRLRLERADVTDRPSVEKVRDRINGDWGAPSVVINNAGIDQPPSASAPATRLEDVPLAVSRAILEVNTLGAFLVAQVFGPAMIDARHGSIVNIGSLYASVAPDPRFYDHIESDPPFFKPPAYGASKAALVNLTKYLATAWGRYGVRVNALSPGGVLGDQDELFKGKFCSRVPLGRMAEEDDLVGPLLFLASDESRYVTGTELVVDGGFTAW